MAPAGIIKMCDVVLLCLERHYLFTPAVVCTGAVERSSRCPTSWGSWTRRAAAHGSRRPAWAGRGETLSAKWLLQRYSKVVWSSTCHLWALCGHGGLDVGGQLAPCPVRGLRIGAAGAHAHALGSREPRAGYTFCVAETFINTAACHRLQARPFMPFSLLCSSPF